MVTTDGHSQPQIYEIFLNNTSALSDAWAIDPEPAGTSSFNNYLVFASLAAPITTIKSIRAHLGIRSEPGQAYITPYDQDAPQSARYSVRLDRMKNPHSWQTRIPSIRRHHHLIMACRNTPPEDGDGEEDELDTFYCFARTPEGGPQSFYRQFTSRSPTPTIPQWAPALWQHLLDTGQAYPISTHRICAWRCDIDLRTLEAHICSQVAAGRLPITNDYL